MTRRARAEARDDAELALVEADQGVERALRRRGVGRRDAVEEVARGLRLVAARRGPTFVDGSRYEGEYVVVDGQRKRSGKGTMIQGPETSEGDWADDKLHGAGEIAFATGAKYVGAFAGGKFDGEGEYAWPDGAKYVGGWRDNKMHGMGCYTDTDKVNWKGQFHNGKFYNGKAYATLR